MQLLQHNLLPPFCATNLHSSPSTHFTSVRKVAKNGLLVSSCLLVCLFFSFRMEHLALSPEIFLKFCIGLPLTLFFNRTKISDTIQEESSTLIMKFYVFLTVHHSIDFSKYQLNAQLFYSSTIYMLHYTPQHVSSNTLLIIRRTNCITTASGIVTLQTAVQYVGGERTADAPLRQTKVFSEALSLPANPHFCLLHNLRTSVEGSCFYLNHMYWLCGYDF